ncbi:response regulator transcription factor [Mangrovicoccus ximenensis]|uniref:response regulator transcription factor n=1 Tax=Mangrovicoccus ximenensis TaxID=1911570 RepID=UPI000D38BC81|nr:response regulator transcription factor [Mangrovicoccus ximenensis]
MDILVVEDDPDLGDLLCDTLRGAGHEVQLCRDGESGLEAAAEPGRAAVVLDVMLPGFSGFEICQRLREQAVTTPVMMLTCRDGEADIVRGLRLGADDYMAKPFSTAEFLARIDALIRRAGSYARAAPLAAGPVLLDLGARSAACNGRELSLTQREFELLAYLVRNARRAVSRDELLAQVWNDDGTHTTNVVDVYAGYLRRKLAAAGAPDLLRTVRGFGFRIAAGV